LGRSSKRRVRDQCESATVGIEQPVTRIRVGGQRGVYADCQRDGIRVGIHDHVGNDSFVDAFVNATQLTAQVPASDLAGAGNASVTVQTPAPGGETSNPTLGLIVAVVVAAGGCGGGGSTQTSPPQTHQVTSSGTITLIVK
jgi:hypothetical protein